MSAPSSSQLAPLQREPSCMLGVTFAPRLLKSEARTSQACGDGRALHSFTVSSARLTFFCIADEGMDETRAFQLLTELRAEFGSRYPMNRMRMSRLDAFNFEAVQETACLMLWKFNLPSTPRTPSVKVDDMLERSQDLEVSAQRFKGPAAVSQKNPSKRPQKTIDDSATAVHEKQQKLKDMLKNGQDLEMNAQHAVVLEKASSKGLHRSHVVAIGTVGLVLMVGVFALAMQ